MLRSGFAVWALFLFAPSLAWSGTARNQVHLGQDIRIPEDQGIHNALCVLCSIHLEGQAAKNLVVFAGNVYLDGTVHGNVVDLGGHVTLSGNSHIDRSLVIFGGRLNRDPSAFIGRSTVIVAPIVFLPILLVLGALIFGLILALRFLLLRKTAATYPPLQRL